MKIKINIGKLSMDAELNDTPTAKKVADALPIKSSFNTWGDEIYFSIPVKADLEPSAKAVVELGDIGYWPQGSAFCIFLGMYLARWVDLPRGRKPQSPTAGTRPDGGSPKPSVSTGMREHGTPTQGTGTTVGFSFYSEPGDLWVARRVPTSQLPESSFIVRGSSTPVMVSLGESGGQPRGAA